MVKYKVSTNQCRNQSPVDLVLAEQCRLVAPLPISADHSLVRTNSRERGRGASILEPTPTPEALRVDPTYFIGENAAGIRILFC